MRIHRWLWLVLGLAWMGCGPESSSAELATGDLRVVVREVGKLDWAARVELTLEPQARGQRVERTLTREGEGGAWDTRFEALPAGAYLARARAFEGEAGGTPRAVSHPVQVVITGGRESLLFLVLGGSLRPEPAEELPFFASVFLDRHEVEQWEQIHIQVQGGGGLQPLVLSGREGAERPRGSFSEPTEMDFDGDAIGEAALFWNPPPVEGERTLLLRLTDARQNSAELALQVRVGQAHGSVDFEGVLHLAPTVHVQSRITSESTGALLLAWVEVEADLGRDLPAERRYRWESEDCQGVFLDEGGAAAGVFQANDPERPGAMHFRYFIEDGERPAAGTCTLRLTLAEWSEGGDGTLEEGITRTLHLELDASLVEPSGP